MNVETLLRFHEGLNEAIKLWAKMIDVLLEADTRQAVGIAFALIDLQPDARYIDTIEY